MIIVGLSTFGFFKWMKKQTKEGKERERLRKNERERMERIIHSYNLLPNHQLVLLKYEPITWKHTRYPREMYFDFYKISIKNEK